MKEEALKLADELVTTLFEDSRDYMQEASTMIRRLVEELGCAEDYIKQYQLQTKPLTNEEIAEIYKDFTMFNTPYWFARAIEERHGIK